MSEDSDQASIRRVVNSQQRCPAKLSIRCAYSRGWLTGQLYAIMMLLKEYDSPAQDWNATAP